MGCKSVLLVRDGERVFNWRLVRLINLTSAGSVVAILRQIHISVICMGCTSWSRSIDEPINIHIESD